MSRAIPLERLEGLSERLKRSRDAALMQEFIPIGRLLDKLPAFKRLGLNEALFFLRSHWSHVAGDALSRHSVPKGLKGGILEVQVDSPLFRQELTYAAPRILRIAQDHLGEELVRSVRASRS